MIFDLGQNPWDQVEGGLIVGWYGPDTVERSRGWDDITLMPIRPLTPDEDIFGTGLVACNLRMVLRESAP